MRTVATRATPRNPPSTRATTPSTDSTPPSGWDALPLHLRARLVGYGINSFRGWQRLSTADKSKLFGITRAHVALIDELARGAR